jgi:lipopolysaccharide transport system permease protein
VTRVPEAEVAATDGARGAVAGAEEAVRGGGRPRRERVAYLWDVTMHLVGRDFRSRHRGSLLGWLWVLAPPLLQLLVTYFLFTKVIPLKVDNYPVFLLAGILVWNCFTRATSLAVLALEQSRELVHRPGFPTVVLPVKAVLIGFVDYLLALPVLLIALVFTTGLHWTAFFLPVLMAIQFVLSLGIAWIVAPLQVYFRDIQYAVALVLMIGFWITPVFYERSSVPSQFDWLYQLNPMAHLVEWQRWIMLDGTHPTALAVLALSAASAALAAVGFWVFVSLRHSIPEQL